MHGGDVRRGALGHHHVLGDLDPHGAHRLDARLGLPGRGQWRRRSSGRRRGRNVRRSGSAVRRRRLGRLARHVGFHVLLGDPSAGAGAFHFAEIDIVLARHLAHQRRKRPGGLRGRRLFHRLGSRSGLDGFLHGRGLHRSRRGRRGRCSRLGSLGRRGRGGAPSAFLDPRHHGIDADGLALFHQHFRQCAGGGRRNFGVHLIGRDLE